jgi:hypothetical protein
LQVPGSSFRPLRVGAVVGVLYKPCVDLHPYYAPSEGRNASLMRSVS